MAVSMHPCTPTQPGKTIKMYCQSGNFDVSIEINYFVSPQSALCTGENFYENRTASLTIKNVITNQNVFVSVLPHNTFSYTVSPKVTFTSEKANLYLEKCVTPVARF